MSWLVGWNLVFSEEWGEKGGRKGRRTSSKVKILLSLADVVDHRTPYPNGCRHGCRGLDPCWHALGTPVRLAAWLPLLLNVARRDGVTAAVLGARARRHGRAVRAPVVRSRRVGIVAIVGLKWVWVIL